VEATAHQTDSPALVLIRIFALPPCMDAFSSSGVSDLAIWLCLACGCRANGVGGHVLRRTFDHIRTVASFHDTDIYSYAVLQYVALNFHCSANNLIDLLRHPPRSTGKKGSSRDGSQCGGKRPPHSAEFSMTGGGKSNDLAIDLTETTSCTRSKISTLILRLEDARPSRVEHSYECGHCGQFFSD
jgi:hypothetical protein